ncbi:MAG: bifunctional diaminohydroxyphosphoribosylaminopyrimidine deaminase/5-amino-6-(5-phosphoribosylamino)uracil reductase RibD [Chloroherpetonaceae bacterium]|nr:bifunctional diaminohydroxyphosphoribosylaminopyrimidine deaminase/5-amino-6-(5-phosphoribosylamino)uracil reductase RibD [Chloroherpetonaceae bacterium]
MKRKATTRPPEASFDADDVRFMKRCLSLAKRGEGLVSPNPMVGSVVVYKGKIIGEGWHKKYGEWHAEVNAINSVKNPEFLSKSTLYVNLEPCSHFGKTPPCSDLIIEKKIPKVVIGCKDPFPKVSGRGIKKLSEAGVEVHFGLLEQESKQLNEHFISFHANHRPFFGIKVAQSLDGRIATATKDSKWISSESARAYAHLLRSQYDAVMIGTGTALTDNPALTVRNTKGRNPKRIVLDRKLSIPLHATIFSNDSPTFLFTSRVNKKHPKIKALSNKGILIRFVGEKQEGLNIEEISQSLFDEKILSVLVEGGGKLHASLLKLGLGDKIHIFISPKIIGGDGTPSIGTLGIKSISESLSIEQNVLKVFGDTLLIEGYL